MKRARRFAADKSGNFAMLAAILSVPLVLSAGVVLDVSTITRVKTELQQAIDSAVLAVAREGKDISDQQAQEIANAFISNNLDPKFTKLTVVRGDTTVSVKAQTKANMAFGGLFGYDEWPIIAAATADTAYASYEIALVLDTTGSMKGGKLTAMKDAVTGLIETMSSQVNDKNKLKFSIVPFSSFVNVGPEHGPDFDKDGKQIPGTGAEWLDLKGTSQVEQLELGVGASRFQIYNNLGQKWSGCVETRVPGNSEYDVSDAAAQAGKPDSLFIPAFAIDEPDIGYANSYITSGVDPTDTSKKAKKDKWKKYGVATDDDGHPLLGGLLNDLLDGLLGGGDGKPKRVKIDTGPSGPEGFSKGPTFNCAAQPITPLTNDYAGLADKVDALLARGNTNIMEGVAWGMRVLTPGEPFTQGQDKKKFGIEKIMIVLTDGANVMGNNKTALKSTYSSFGYLVDGRLGISTGSSSDTNGKMNAKTLAACNYAKDEGIVVYTIRLEEPDVKTGTMLQECATSPTHYFDAPSRTQLDEVFQSIKDSIVRVRISS